MHKIQTITITILVISAAILPILGCEESSQYEIKQARLTGQENIELKQQIESLKGEIQKQKDLLAKSEKEKQDVIQEASDSSIKMMKILAETSKENEELKTEIAQLQNKIKALQAKIDEAAPE